MYHVSYIQYKFYRTNSIMLGFIECFIALLTNNFHARTTTYHTTNFS